MKKLLFALLLLISIAGKGQTVYKDGIGTEWLLQIGDTVGMKIGSKIAKKPITGIWIKFERGFNQPTAGGYDYLMENGAAYPNDRAKYVFTLKGSADKIEGSEIILLHKKASK